MLPLYLLPDNRNLAIAADETILAATLRQGVPHAHACGGHAQCSTCRVHVLDGLAHCSPRTAGEQALADRLRLPAAVRLACQTTSTGPLRLRRPILDALDVELTRHTLSHPDHQEGTQQQVAVLFSDIEDYTAFADAVPAYDVIHVLNRYFETMGEVVRTHNGHVSDYIGDGLMAVFGLAQPTTAVADALAAGQAMLRQVAPLNTYLQHMYDRTFRVRLGLHYGPAVVGHIGGGGLRKLATIGDTVNVAARIESANKEFGTYFLVSQAVVDAAGPSLVTGQEFRARLKGKKSEYHLYEVASTPVAAGAALQRNLVEVDENK
ncbi:adenylate/guanylate cyclase domain-containing protein [Hymenobacter sp. UYCo722]|uniref:adenylate/guanylate cyclase domain-containing protein n=1 Tax=Hymenobacter sp. UYCo722 TaxID=3156335 RepID=UPI00339183CB